jgi:hypothetical protein
MLPLMSALHYVVPNWGVVIILFSIIIKIVLHPLTRSSMRSMKKMQALQPLMNEILEKYKDEPLAAMYHGTWSAGPWDEIFHPQGKAPQPPDYAPEKFVRGMIEQLDVLIDEFCVKGKVAELPYSGKYPPKQQIDITGPLTARIVERLGRRSPYLYIQSNGWGLTARGVQTVSWGHEQDINDALGRVNLALQALGTNAGGGWAPQGDWVGLVRIAQEYDVPYVEIYPPDLMPLDTGHRIVEALAAAGAAGSAAAPPDGFVAFRPWLKERRRVLYVRDGVLCRSFWGGAGERRVDRLVIRAETPPGTSISCRARSRPAGGGWSEWQEAARAAALPPAAQLQVEARLHTDDGLVTPRLLEMRPAWR